MDVFSPEKRSEIMSRIRGRDNRATEEVVANLFRQHRIKGWRRQYSIFGTPDFAFVKQRVAVFVDGCYWHGCPRCQKLPESNREYWLNKFAANRLHDHRVSRELRKRGWVVIRVWQCRLKAPASFIGRVRRALEKRSGCSFSCI